MRDLLSFSAKKIAGSISFREVNQHLTISLAQEQGQKASQEDACSLATLPEGAAKLSKEIMDFCMSRATAQTNLFLLENTHKLALETLKELCDEETAAEYLANKDDKSRDYNATLENFMRKAGEEICKTAFSPLFKRFALSAFNAGTTCAVAVIINDICYPYNMGDGAIIAIAGEDVKLITRRHTAADPDEVERIIAAGGTVAKGRIAGKLEPSRTLGDFRFTLLGLSSTPECADSINLMPGHRVIITTDGFFEGSEFNEDIKNFLLSWVKENKILTAQSLIDEQRMGRVSNSSWSDNRSIFCMLRNDNPISAITKPVVVVKCDGHGSDYSGKLIATVVVNTLPEQFDAIITQVLNFCSQHGKDAATLTVKDIEALFESIPAITAEALENAKKLDLSALVTSCCYDYFVKQFGIDEKIFDSFMQRLSSQFQKFKYQPEDARISAFENNRVTTVQASVAVDSASFFFEPGSGREAVSLPRQFEPVAAQVSAAGYSGSFFDASVSSAVASAGNASNTANNNHNRSVEAAL